MWITSMWPLKLFLYGIGSLAGHSPMVYHSAAYPLCSKSHLAFSVLLSLQLHKHRKPKDTVCEQWIGKLLFYRTSSFSEVGERPHSVGTRLGCFAVLFMFTYVCYSLQFLITYHKENLLTGSAIPFTICWKGRWVKSVTRDINNLRCGVFLFATAEIHCIHIYIFLNSLCQTKETPWDHPNSE